MEMINIPLLTLLALFGYGEGANVLVVIPFTTKSHYISLRPIGVELARRGHNVTAITAFREKNPPPNYHEVMVDMKEIWELMGTGERPNVFGLVDMPPEQVHKTFLWEGGIVFTEHILKSPDVQRFLHKDQAFDIVIAEQFYMEATYMLAHKYQAPLITMTSFGNCMRHNIMTRNPLQLATVLSELIKVENPASFWGRLWNMYFTVYEFINIKYWYLSAQEDVAKKLIPNLPEPVPSLYEIQKNTTLMLYNSHFSFNPPTAYLPNIVEVGGMHLMASDGNLPKDLQKVLDEASEGVVYVNFGSNLRSNELPEKTRDAYIKVFRKLRQTVIWKWEDETLENIPKNLVIRKWLPQKEILSHPNIKVFISHGGLIGTQEAVFHGVPIIGVPIYGDQFNNLLQIQEHGIGKLLRYNDINENTLENMLHEILTNKSYCIKAKELSRRFKDRPMTALDTAMFWIEYVIRNNGAEFIKNPARNLHWFQSNMLDVYSFILILLIVALLVIFGVTRILINIAFSHSNKYSNEKKKKK